MLAILNLVLSGIFFAGNTSALTVSKATRFRALGEFFECFECGKGRPPNLV